MQQGKEVGSKESTIIIAKELIAENTDLTIISRATGLSQKEVQSLVKQIANQH